MMTDRSGALFEAWGHAFSPAPAYNRHSVCERSEISTFQHAALGWMTDPSLLPNSFVLVSQRHSFSSFLPPPVRLLKSLTPQPFCPPLEIHWSMGHICQCSFIRHSVFLQWCSFGISPLDLCVCSSLFSVSPSPWEAVAHWQSLDLLFFGVVCDDFNANSRALRFCQITFTCLESALWALLAK